ncbi:MAG: type IV pilin N-terminal domain-containing protein [Natronomonas sp.]
MSDTSANTSLLGIVLMTAVVVGMATAVGAVVGVQPPQPAPTAVFDLDAEPDGTVTLTHRHGDSLDPASLSVHVTVDGEPLADQPPVPFFSAEGFVSGPTGAFNSAKTTEWDPGETASFRIAGSNTPVPKPGAELEVRLTTDAGHVTTLQTVVGAS